MAGGGRLVEGHALRGEGRIFKACGVNGLAALLAGLVLNDLGNGRDGLGLRVGGIVPADARRGDAAQILGPLVRGLAPVVAGGRRLVEGHALRGEGGIAELYGIDGLAALLAALVLNDLKVGRDGLGLGMGGVGETAVGRGDGAQILGPLVFRLAPVVPGSGRLVGSSALFGKSGVFKACGVDGLTGFLAALFLRDLRGGRDGLCLCVGGVPRADARRRDRAQIFGPFILGFSPIVPEGFSLGLAAFGAGFRLRTGRVFPLVLVAAAGKQKDQGKRQQNSKQSFHHTSPLPFK